MKIQSFVAVFIFLIFSSCNISGYNEKEKQVFSKIKQGMHKDEVLKILGQPDTISYSIVDSSFYTFYYFTKNKFGTSTLPQVNFDSTNVVTSTIYGDGG